ncbi:MAG: Mur ligase family protein, partial [Segetibacter sp.]
QFDIPVSYSLGAELSFGPMGKFDASAKYFVYECDEFDRNFLQFQPFIAAITNIDYDHPDTYKTENDYVQAFGQFARQSQRVIAAQPTQKKLGLQPANGYQKSLESLIQLPGLHNRQNAALAISVMRQLSDATDQQLIDCIQNFPGSARRFEKLADSLYSDYAHHPVEIAATLQLVSELTDNIVVVYQPHQNIRQQLIKDDYKKCFKKAKKIYWLPTFLSREDESIAILSAQQLSSGIDQKKIVFSKLNQDLWRAICKQRANNNVVVAMGAGSIDNWVRRQLQAETSV